MVRGNPPEVAFQLGGGVGGSSLVRDDAVRARGDAKERRRELRVGCGALGARAVGQDVPERGGYRGVRRGGGGGAGGVPERSASFAESAAPTACSCHVRASDVASLAPTGPPIPPCLAAASMTIADVWGERKSVARSSHADVAATVSPAPADPTTKARRALDPDAPAAARSKMRAQDSGAAATHCHAAFVAASPTPGSGAAARTAASPLADRAKARHTDARLGASSRSGDPPALGGGRVTSAPAAAASVAAICGTALVSHAILGAANNRDAALTARADRSFSRSDAESARGFRGLPRRSRPRAPRRWPPPPPASSAARVRGGFAHASTSGGGAARHVRQGAGSRARSAAASAGGQLSSFRRLIPEFHHDSRNSNRSKVAATWRLRR